MMAKYEANSQSSKIFQFFRTWCAYLLLQYELITCTCMFEPWEKIFINCLVLTLFSLVTYSSLVYLPPYLMSLFTYCHQITGVVASLPLDL